MLLPTRPPAARRGLSLLEVLVALAIFLLSFIAIGRLISLAGDQALEIQQQSQATRLAQSKLNEVLCGALALESTEGDFDEDPEWHFKVDAEQNADASGLWNVTVTVNHPGSEPDVSATVAQMVLDPSLRGSVFDTLTVTGSTDQAPATSGTTPGQGSSGAGGQAGGGAMAGGAAGGATKGRGGVAGGGNNRAPGNNNRTPPGNNNNRVPGNNNRTPPGNNNNNRTPPGNNNNNNRPPVNNPGNPRGGPRG